MTDQPNGSEGKSADSDRNSADSDRRGRGSESDGEGTLAEPPVSESEKIGSYLTQVVPYGNQRRCQRIIVPRSRLNGQKRQFAFHNQGSSAGYGYNTQLGLGRVLSGVNL